MLLTDSTILREGKRLDKKAIITFEARTRLSRQYKFGVLLERAYQRHGRASEDDLYNTNTTSDELEEFLRWIATRIELKGWTKYRGGLDATSIFSLLP